MESRRLLKARESVTGFAATAVMDRYRRPSTRLASYAAITYVRGASVSGFEGLPESLGKAD